MNAPKANGQSEQLRGKIGESWVFEGKQVGGARVVVRLVSNLEPRDLLRAISASIRQDMHCDVVGVWLPDAPAKFPDGELWGTSCTFSTVGGKKKTPTPPVFPQGCESIEVMRCDMHKDVIPW